MPFWRREAEPRVKERFLGSDVRSRFLREIISPQVTHDIVLMAFSRVDRLPFMPEDYRDKAYTDEIIPIEGATISQPSLVAKMINLLSPSGRGKILEVGTASGMGAALLSHCAREVHSVEVSPRLAAEARDRLQRLGYRNAHVWQGDGALGLAQKKPYEGILVTAAARSVPTALIAQLSEGGRIVIPVGSEDPEDSQLILGVKEGDKLLVRPAGSVYFMPLISDQRGGWTQEELDRAETRRNSSYARIVAGIAENMQTTVEALHSEFRRELEEEGGKELTAAAINRYIVQIYQHHRLV